MAAFAATNSNQVRREYPRERALHEFIEEQAERHPESAALIFGSQRVSYEELNARANQLAHHLRIKGVGPEVLVCVCLERSADLIVALLGILKAGGAYVPLDLCYPHHRLAMMLTETRPPVLITQERWLAILPKLGIDTICMDRDAAVLGGEPQTNPPRLANGRNLAYMIYTSGSTGTPKGVLNVHEAIVNHLLWMQETHPLAPSDRFLQKTPYSFDVSVWEIFWPLMAGAMLVVAEPEQHKDPQYLTRIIREKGITAAHFVPSMLRLFLENADVPRCSSLRRVFCSGEALPIALQQRFFERLDAQLYNLYGPTEAAVHVTGWTCRRDADQSIVPIGKPIWNTRIEILDPDLQRVPEGQAGELYIGGVALARGYFERPELTAKAFIADPFSADPSERLYKTGDLARYLPDGNIQYLGRIDHQVKIRGMRVELGEIETILNRQPRIVQSEVVVRDNAPGEPQLVAYLVLREGSSLTAAELRQLLLSTVPEYMIPAAFIVLDRFPLTLSGKVDRQKLPQPARHEYASAQAFVPPRDQVESRLSEIWEEILGEGPVGVQDDFCDLGGDSLSAVRLLGRIKQAFGKELPLSALVEAPTVETLAEALRPNGRFRLSESMVTFQNQGSKPPLILCPGIDGHVFRFRALARHLGPDQPVFALRLPSEGRLWPKLTTHEELASYCLSDIQKRQPHGPYFLGGYSFGGLLVFEIAQQLTNRGEQVGMVVLLDAEEWNHKRRLAAGTSSSLRRTQILARFSRMCRPGEFTALGESVRRHAAQLACAVCASVACPTPNRLVRLEDMNFFRAGRYVPQVYPGRLMLIRACPNVKRPGEEYELGWRGLAAGGIEVLDTPGEHLEITQEPHVRVLAKKLKQCLDQTQKDSSLLQQAR
jgi:amino acid adenylation domain-containing protein